MSTTNTSAAVEKVATVIVPVADVDAQIDFYVGKLGFEKRIDLPFGGQYRWVEVGPAGAETTIALAPPPPHKPESGNRETGISLYSADIEGYHSAAEGGRRRRGRRDQPDGRSGPPDVLAARPRGQLADGRRLSRLRAGSGAAPASGPAGIAAADGSDQRPRRLARRPRVRQPPVHGGRPGGRDQHRRPGADQHPECVR